MFYYELALLKSPLNNLTYQSEEDIKIGTKTLVKLQNRKVLNDAIVIKKVEKLRKKGIHYSLKIKHDFNKLSTFQVE